MVVSWGYDIRSFAHAQSVTFASQNDTDTTKPNPSSGGAKPNCRWCHLHCIDGVITTNKASISIPSISKYLLHLTF
jgi:hypothetical protein